MLPLDNERELSKKEKNNLVLITTLFGILAGLWCMGLSGFAELSPIISNKIGYLESIYTILEIILLCIISGSIIQKIQKKKKLLLFETIVACIDVFCLFIAAVTLSWKGLAVAYIITAFTSTIGDPLWGSIMSAYSNGEREKWVLINKVYFIVRTIFTLISWYVCRECVIKGVETFKYLSIILIILMIVIYIISNKINKRIFGNSI